jgi:Putative porin
VHDATPPTGRTGGAHSIKRKGEYRMSMVRLRGRRWAALVVTAVLGLTPIAHAQTSQERRLRQLELELERTQVEMKQLRKEIEQQKAVTRASEEQVQHAADNADVAKAKASKVPDWLNSFTPFGDVRFRYEGFFNQPRLADQVVTANNRLRIRARVGLRFSYSDEVAATFRLASGNINDPISTNQTLTGNFTPFSVNLDWAYLTLAPGKTFDIRPGLFTLNAGKFPNPMFKVGELVFDDDLSPEGLNEIVALLDSPIGDPQSVSLDQVKLYGEQWTFSQVNNRQDGWMFGGQINPQMHVGPVQVEAGLGQYGWMNADQIAQATSRNTTDFTASGAPVANANFNSTLVNTNQIVVRRIQPPTQKGKAQPAAFSATTGFLSHFNQTNFNFATTLPNVVEAQPLRFFFDFVNNWEAVGSNKGLGLQAGLRLGQAKVRGDWSAYALYEYLQQDAVISAFTWSDFGLGGTNEKGPVIGMDYQLLNPLTLSARAYFTNFINQPWVASQGTSNFINNPTQTRLQLEAIAKF